MGRVGRAGAVGIAIITRFMYEECYEIDLISGNKVEDTDAATALGGGKDAFGNPFKIYKCDPNKFATMISNMNGSPD